MMISRGGRLWWRCEEQLEEQQMATSNQIKAAECENTKVIEAKRSYNSYKVTKLANVKQQNSS